MYQSARQLSLRVHFFQTKEHEIFGSGLVQLGQGDQALLE